MANIVKAEHLGEMYDAARRDEITPTRRKWLHKKLKQCELYGKELPFKFGIFKPKLGRKPKDKYVVCSKCGREFVVSSITVCGVCICGQTFYSDE